jgi:NADH:ubiquinone oxidoreductase subunit 6 (subunit J)
MSASGKKFPYVVILKNTTTRAFTLVAILLNVASAVLFFREFVLSGEIQVIQALGVAVLIGMLVWNYFKARRGEKPFYDRAYLVTGLLWMGMPFLQWLFIPFMLLALLEHQVKFPLEIGFSETQIVFNTLFRKKYKWSDLSNVMLRDGLLTMDFANNRLLQREVEDDDEEDDASEEEFNVFCRQQLKKNFL